MNVFEMDHEYVANTYARFPVNIVEGKGSILKDETGKEYIDLGSGIAVNSFGMADEKWIGAVTAQLHAFQPVLHPALRPAGAEAVPAHGDEKGILLQLRR